MQLCDLLLGINVCKSNADMSIDVKYIVNDHRQVRKNDAFVAINGEKCNGND